MNLKLIVWLVFILFATGCATTKNQRDPIEPVNRFIYGFNNVIDKAAIRPVSKVYHFVTPDPIEKRVSNFFSNLGEVRNAINNALQGKFRAAGQSLGRLLMNSTLGLGGLHDMAGVMGLKRQEEDFGQTLGKWGVRNAPYFVIPILGPSTLRDAPGLVVDAFTEPYIYIPSRGTQLALYGVRLIDRRTYLLDFDNTISEQLDPYAFVRDSYLQKRDNDIDDGKEKDLEGYEFK